MMHADYIVHSKLEHMTPSDEKDTQQAAAKTTGSRRRHQRERGSIFETVS